jgi:hypothetical protein
MKRLPLHPASSHLRAPAEQQTAMNRRAFLRHSLLASVGAFAASRWPCAGAEETAYDFWFTRLMYESGDWDVDQRMPTNLLEALVQYTTLRIDTK